jgi:hypothetical protein
VLDRVRVCIPVPNRGCPHLPQQSQRLVDRHVAQTSLAAGPAQLPANGGRVLAPRAARTRSRREASRSRPARRRTSRRHRCRRLFRSPAAGDRRSPASRAGPAGRPQRASAIELSATLSERRPSRVGLRPPSWVSARWLSDDHPSEPRRGPAIARSNAAVPFWVCPKAAYRFAEGSSWRPGLRCEPAVVVTRGRIEALLSVELARRVCPCGCSRRT